MDFKDIKAGSRLGYLFHKGSERIVALRRKRRDILAQKKHLSTIAAGKMHTGTSEEHIVHEGHSDQWSSPSVMLVLLAPNGRTHTQMQMDPYTCSASRRACMLAANNWQGAP